MTAKKSVPTRGVGLLVIALTFRSFRKHLPQSAQPSTDTAAASPQVMHRPWAELTASPTSSPFIPPTVC